MPSLLFFSRSVLRLSEDHPSFLDVFIIPSCPALCGYGSLLFSNLLVRLGSVQCCTAVVKEVLQ